MMSKGVIFSFVAMACVAVFLSACGSKSSKQSCALSGDCEVTKTCQANVCVKRATCTGSCEGGATCISGICMDCLTNDDCNVAKMICNESFVCVYEKCDSTPCGTNATACDDSTGQFVCTCATGYTGDRCDQCAADYEPGDNSTCVPSVHCAEGDPCNDDNPCSQDACDSNTHFCVHTSWPTPGDVNCDPDGVGTGTLTEDDGVCTASMTCLRLKCRECTQNTECVDGYCMCAGVNCSLNDVSLRQ